jgi:hypothetical protein
LSCSEFAITFVEYTTLLTTPVVLPAGRWFISGGIGGPGAALNVQVQFSTGWQTVATLAGGPAVYGCFDESFISDGVNIRLTSNQDAMLAGCFRLVIQ